MLAQTEHIITCPYCWESLEVLLDLTSDSQQYIEDCQICCSPILFNLTVDGESYNLDIQAENY